MQPQALEQDLIRYAVASLVPSVDTAHAAHTAVVEMTDACTHVRIECKNLAAKEQDRQDECLIHQGFDARRHISSCEDGVGEAIERCGGEADPTGELCTVGEGGAEKGPQVGEQMGVMDGASAGCKVRRQG